MRLMDKVRDLFRYLRNLLSLRTWGVVAPLVLTGLILFCGLSYGLTTFTISLCFIMIALLCHILWTSSLSTRVSNLDSYYVNRKQLKDTQDYCLQNSNEVTVKHVAVPLSERMYRLEQKVEDLQTELHQTDRRMTRKMYEHVEHVGDRLSKIEGVTKEEKEGE